MCFFLFFLDNISCRRIAEVTLSDTFEHWNGKLSFKQQRMALYMIAMCMSYTCHVHHLTRAPITLGILWGGKFWMFIISTVKQGIECSKKLAY